MNETASTASPPVDSVAAIAPAAPGRLAGLIGAFRANHLVKNAAFIALSNASMGALGFAFWVLAARLFSPNQVGIATSLVTAAILIGYLSQMGFNSTFVQYLPTSDRRDAEINTGITVVFITAGLLSIGYIAVAPVYVLPLRFLWHSPLEALALVVFVMCGSVNLVTDSVFIVYRSAFYNFLIDGVAQSIVRLAIPVFVVGLAGFGLFAATGTASVVAVAISIALLMAKYSYRPRVQVSMDVLRSVFRFGAANYAADLLATFPILIVPTVIVRESGAAAGGYFYVSIQVAYLLFSGSLAVCKSLFAEGSNRAGTLWTLGWRSARLQAALLLPPALVLVVCAKWILAVFGPGYAHHAQTTLMILAASTPAVILNNWTSTLLRMRRQLRALVASNVVFVASTCFLAIEWAGKGIAWVALAWLIGNFLSGVAGTVPLLVPAKRAFDSTREENPVLVDIEVRTTGPANRSSVEP